METVSISREELDNLLGMTEEALQAAKSAHEQLAHAREENNTLRKAAEESKVRLEKIASETPRLDESLVDATVYKLVQTAFIAPDFQEKFASELKQNPDTAFRLIQRIVDISAQPYEEGRGYPKAASTKSTEPGDDLWAKVLEEGA